MPKYNDAKINSNAILKKAELKKRIHDYENIIRVSLRENVGTRKEAAVERVVRVIKLAKDKGLREFMRETNYFVFDWAIEHENLELIDMLFEAMKPEDHFLMLCNNDYASVKDFVARSLKSDYSKSVFQVKETILTKLIKVDPVQMFSVIEAYTKLLKNSDSSISSDSYLMFHEILTKARDSNINTAANSSFSFFCERKSKENTQQKSVSFVNSCT